MFSCIATRYKTRRSPSFPSLENKKQVQHIIPLDLVRVYIVESFIRLTFIFLPSQSYQMIMKHHYIYLACPFKEQASLDSVDDDDDDDDLNAKYIRIFQD